MEEYSLELQEEQEFDLKMENDIQPVVTTDYEKLQNLPSVNSVILKGNKQFSDLGLKALTNSEIEDLLGGLD